MDESWLLLELSLPLQSAHSHAMVFRSQEKPGQRGRRGRGGAGRGHQRRNVHHGCNAAAGLPGSRPGWLPVMLGAGQIDGLILGLTGCSHVLVMARAAPVECTGAPDQAGTAWGWQGGSPVMASRAAEEKSMSPCLHSGHSAVEGRADRASTSRTGGHEMSTEGMWASGHAPYKNHNHLSHT